MTDEDRFARRLREERSATDDRREALSRDLELLMQATADSPDDEHDPEGATIGFERAQVSALLADARRRLVELDAAEGRFRAGVYGICEACGGPIPDARLVARPEARRCMACA